MSETTEEATSSFKDYILGINLNKSDKQLETGELLAANNWKYGDSRSLQTREGVKKITTAALANSKYIKHIAYVPVESTAYIYAVANDYKLYRLTGSEPSLAYGTLLGTLADDATIVSFNGYGIVLDGSYIKTVQGGAADLSLAYDDGSGVSGYQYTNICGDCDASTNLYSGSVTRCGSKVPTLAWDAGYTIPITSTEFWLSKTGSPTGTITAKLYDSTGANLLQTATKTLSAENLTAYAFKKSFAFDNSYDMALSTDYIFCVEYSGGDSSNYVTVHATGEASGGKQYQYTVAGGWAAISTKSPLMGVKPGRPPKGSFGDVRLNRLFVAGDPDNPGRVWFSKPGVAFDWSTPDISGYVGAVDDDANSYEVGGIVAHFGDLYIIGKKEQPYLSILVGANPSEFALPASFQYISTNHKCLISVVNDIWCASEDAVNALSGVEAYGDIRAFSEGDPVKPIIRDYFSTTAFAGYNPKDGQYLLKLESYDNILVCHTKHTVTGDNGNVRYPWTTYRLKNLTPSAFSSFNNKFYIGCTNGNIYIFDSSLVEDAGTLPDYTLTSGISETSFQGITYRGLFAQIDSASWSLDYKTDISLDETGGVYSINSAGSDFETASLGVGVKIRISGTESNDGVFTVSSATTSKITVNEAITDEAAGNPISISLDWGSLSFYKNGSSSALVAKTIKTNNSPRREQVRFNVKSIQWSLHNMTISNHIKFNGIELLGRQSGGLI